MTTLEANFDNLPQPIIDKLQLMIRRVRRLLFIRGLFATLAVALICLLVIMALDATVTIFSGSVRWALSLAGLGIAAVTAWWFLVRPLSKKITLTHIARILEIRHPELQERISTAVELMSSDDPDSVKGSEELIEAVVDSAVIDVEAVDPKTEFKPARAKKFITTTGICLGLIALLLAIWPQQSWTLLTRALAPFLDIGNAYAETLVIDPGDIRVAKGDSVTITMTIGHKRLRRAEVRRRLANGKESVERMVLMGETEEGHKRFSLTFPKVEDDFEYRVRAGSAVSEFYTVEVVPLPVIEEVKIRYDFPEYTGKKPEESISKTGEIRALANTEVTVQATTNKAVWSSKLLFNEHQEIGEPVTEGNTTTWKFPLKPRMNGTWQLDFSDSDGFKNADTSYPMQALPDKAPTVQIKSPVSRELRLKPTEFLPIKYESIEDFGFEQVVILVTPNGEISPLEINQAKPVKDANPGVWNGTAELNIAALDLKPHHNKLSVQIRARDNRPETFSGPGEGISETITIILDKNAKSLAEQAIAEDKKTLTEALRDAQKELARAKSEIANTERELQRQEEFSETARKELADFNQNKKAAEQKLNDAIKQLEDGVFKKQAEALRHIIKDEMVKAQESADMIPVTDKKEERVAEAKEVQTQVNQAIADLKEVEKSIRDSESERKMITDLNNLANKQREIARDAEDRSEKQTQEMSKLSEAQKQAMRQQLDKAQQNAMKKFRADQKQVQQKLGEMLKENAAALEEVLEQQKEESLKLSAEAAKLALAQEDLKKLNQEATNKSKKSEDLKKQLIAQLQKKQNEIAAATQSKKNPPAPSESAPTQKAEAEGTPEKTPETGEATPLEKAKKQTEAASLNLKSETLALAMKEAREASKSLAEAANQAKSKTTAAESPSPDAKNSESPTPAQEKTDEGKAAATPSEGENAKALSKLSEQQEAVAEQIAAVESGDLQEALALMEAQLSDDSETLQAEAQNIEDTLSNLKQTSAKNQVDQAGRAFDRAEAKADSAAKQLAQAQAIQEKLEQQKKAPPGEIGQSTQQAMRRSQPSQQETENLLKQAAKAMAQSAKAIGQTMEGLDPSDQDKQTTNSEDMAKSFDDVTDSAKSEDAQEAAEQSQEAAQSLQQLAQAAMKKLGDLNQGPPDSNQQSQQQDEEGRLSETESQDLNESGKKTTDSNGDGIPPALKRLGISLEDWTRFKGVLAGGSATSIESDLPEEYRELVGRYFQVIAKEAGK